MTNTNGTATTKVKATVEYEFEIPTDVFNALEARDDSSLTELVDLLVRMDQVGDPHPIRTEGENDVFVREFLRQALIETDFTTVDWSGGESDFNWEGV